MSNDVYSYLVDSLKKMNYDVTDVTPTTPLGAAGLDLESLAVAEIAIQIEDAYGVKLDEDETERLALMTIGELADEISSRLTVAK